MYLHHHRNNLHMKRSAADPCVLIRRKGQHLSGLILLQMDDSLGFDDDCFLKEEELHSAEFRSKSRKFIEESPVSFNGVELRHFI